MKALTTPDHEGKKYVLTGAELLSTAEQVDLLGAALGRPLRFVDVPEAGARAGMLKSGMNEALIDAVLELMSRVGAGGEALLTPTVREVTGAEPRRVRMRSSGLSVGAIDAVSSGSSEGITHVSNTNK